MLELHGGFYLYSLLTLKLCIKKGKITVSPIFSPGHHMCVQGKGEEMSGSDHLTVNIHILFDNITCIYDTVGKAGIYTIIVED